MPEIGGYEVFKLPPRSVVVRVETRDGLVGWGEVIAMSNARTVAAAVRDMADTFLIGSDPLRTEDIWQRLYREQSYRGGPVLISAISSLDQALWDLKGKHYDVPVYEFLGGRVRDRIWVYADVGGADPEELATSAREAVDEGYSALKTRLFGVVPSFSTPRDMDQMTAKMAAVREAAGDDVDVAIDFKGRTSKAQARQFIDAIEPYAPMFVEEPVLPQYDAALPEIADRTHVPIAAGERLHTLAEFESLLETRSVDVLQPNVATVGGISELMRIATTARTHDVVLSPHSPFGSIGLAASLHVCAAAPNVVLQQHGVSRHRKTSEQSYLLDADPFDFEDGYLDVPDGPGLGVEPDVEFIREQSQNEVSWRRPTWRHDDGSLADR